MKAKREYLYKLTGGFVKHPCFLEEYGFKPYKSDNDEEIFYAKGIVLPVDCSIVKYIKKAFEKVHKKADNKEDFSEYKFNKDGSLHMNKKVKKEFTECQLCVATSGLGKFCLFINAPDRCEYYNTEVLDECVGDFIDILLNNKVIYAKRNKRR